MTSLPTIRPGTFWYHPHRHGVGFVQVGSGMAGALIISGDRLPTATGPGDMDVLLKDESGRSFPERAMIFQQIKYGCLDDKGAIEGQRDKANEPVRPFTCSAGKIGRIESSTMIGVGGVRAGSPESTERCSPGRAKRSPAGSSAGA